MENELERFEKAFWAVLSSEVLPMDGMMRYVSSVPGKRLRPRLVFLSAKLFGEVNDVTRRTALFVEMFHTATLIHDDVVDGSDTRRGQASLNAHLDNKSAVLAGDYLLAKALAQLSHPEDHQILQEMLKVAMAMSEGELIQSGKLKVESGKVYLDIITRKTARLIQACCVCGAMSVTSNLQPLTSHLISDFGLNLGLVFQMRDDILDNDDPATTVMAQRLLPEYLDKALKNLDALTPYIIDKDAWASLRELTVFCAERNH
ncbi:MAG: polyprenyl synthetase family protein [Bacteroidales bacterium]|nr:polyprenyl synthetase family protein [Bacteroidales bacterium]